MTVKVKRKTEAMGTEFEATVYFPENVLLTRDRREKADKLDNVIKAKVEGINKEYDTLGSEFKKRDIEKWRWLGKKLNDILESTPLIEQVDIDNYYIWPAIGQYLRKELSRGLNDKKRSGTKNDHYRKCQALCTIPGTDWINSWVGWDAFTDRGDQIVYSKRLMPLLRVKFNSLEVKLRPDDYKEIAKIIVSYLPTQVKKPTDIDSIPETKLVEIAESVHRDFMKRWKPN